MADRNFFQRVLRDITEITITRGIMVLVGVGVGGIVITAVPSPEELQEVIRGALQETLRDGGVREVVENAVEEAVQDATGDVAQDALQGAEQRLMGCAAALVEYLYENPRGPRSTSFATPSECQVGRQGGQ